MKTISRYILVNLLGWRIVGEFPVLKKSVVIFAPHTSFLDALYGKLYINELRVKYRILSKKELFFFPMNIAMKLYGSIPVRNENRNNAIYRVVKLFKNSDDLHIILSPEGTRSKVKKWDKGFYYMALKANVPIIVGYLDYKRKEIGIKGVINNLENIDTVMQQINLMYKDVSAKYPENFSLELKV
ncbi:MAG: 1-acyl-sn-glycerol-3-phosphate acyltransferase [Bacteroidales bacterium]|nr:1-acyl-sn-glycerol-3-phosphate acyltransferase [Bacteroidales bacterium]